jgi:peroxiredoxin (alkyl hydroperoxide reductase subunit C)
MEGSKDRMENAGGDITCYDWFFCTKKLPKEEVEKKLGKK